MAPIGLTLAAGIALLAPQLAAALMTLVVDDPDGHPVVRLGMDLTVLAGSLLLVELAPMAALALAALPVLSLVNQWAERVAENYRRRICLQT